MKQWPHVSWSLAAIVAFAGVCALQAQETPPSNRNTWFEVLPEPLPEGVNALGLEMSSLFLRSDFEQSGDGKSIAQLDGEEWMLTGDLATRTGPLVWDLRIRAAHRSGGVLDQGLATWHKILGTPLGGRELAPKWRLSFHLEREGQVVGDLNQPGTHLLDTDLSVQLPVGDEQAGARFGISIQLPTGHRENFSGNGATDGLAGIAAWKRFQASTGHWRIHGQAERGYLGLNASSPYRAVLAQRAFSRIWAGGGWQGQGSGFWQGLGLDLTLAYAQSPYRVEIARIDRSGWQQHWTLTHRALPRWTFGFSEEAGTYNAPDFTAFVGYRWKN